MSLNSIIGGLCVYDKMNDYASSALDCSIGGASLKDISEKMKRAVPR
ncbi:MAG: hypothetical protein JWO58_3159 [Chitinophagaceae bacterium]|nr:hypothetical protein [Chitinophagaceae bacterium]